MKDNYNILIVDDNVINIDLLCEFLEEYELFTSLDGKQALEIVNSENIDLILLDIMMPHMDGFEVCKKLKENEKTKNIPVIFISSKDDIENIKKGFELGAVDYVTKPFNPTELKVRINNHLQLNCYKLNLEKKVNEEVEKNRLKDQIIYQTSKQSEIGELLIHIAHQWKQPLSELANINLFNMTKLEIDGDIPNDILRDKMEKTADIIEFMSNTVDTFQNFYKPRVIEEEFSVKDAVNESIDLVQATFNYHKIGIDVDIKEDVTIFGKSNEYSQVILSMLNNAKDVLIERKIENPEVKIIIEKQNDKSLVTIIDNAGGIDLENKNDIFLPFVSGKGSSGVGLYMSKIIIEKNSGDLSVENCNGGACFMISI